MHSTQPNPNAGENYFLTTFKQIENILPPCFTPCLPPHTSYTNYSEYFWDKQPLSVSQNSFSPILYFERNATLTIICKYTPQCPLKERPASQTLLQEDEVYCLKISLGKSTVPLLERDAEISRYLQKQLSEKEHTSSSLSSSHVIANIKAYLSDYFILVRDYVDGVSL